MSASLPSSAGATSIQVSRGWCCCLQSVHTCICTTYVVLIFLLSLHQMVQRCYADLELACPSLSKCCPSNQAAAVQHCHTLLHGADAAAAWA